MKLRITSNNTSDKKLSKTFKIGLWAIVICVMLVTVMSISDDDSDYTYTEDEYEEEYFDEAEYEQPQEMTAEDAEIWYYNEETGFYCGVLDYADLLSDDESLTLLDELYNMTYQGHAAVVTGYFENDVETEARSTYKYMFDEETGYLLLVDMNNRQLGLCSFGDFQYIITPSYCDSICDNIYRYAKNGDFLGCAIECNNEAISVVNGEKIARPMKYICNALIAAILALLINFFIARLMSMTARPSDKEILTSIHNTFSFNNAVAVHTHSERVYSPRSSDDDSGSSSSGGGGSSGSHGF